MDKKFRVFATCDIGEAIDLLRHRGYEFEVYPRPEAPPKGLIIEKGKSGADGLITTLRDPIAPGSYIACRTRRWRRCIRAWGTGPAPGSPARPGRAEEPRKRFPRHARRGARPGARLRRSNRAAAPAGPPP